MTGIKPHSMSPFDTRGKTTILSPCAPPSLPRMLWAGFVGGNIASFVKWGTEMPLPPRTPDRPSPPAEMLRDFGVSVDHLVYSYSGHLVQGGVLLVHHLFSIVFALLYCVLCRFCPRIALAQGLAFGLVVTILFHGVVLPMGQWAPPLWALPPAEIMSETLGHLLWAWVIDLVRREIMGASLPRASAEVSSGTL
ncbi:hypothetical protein AA0535_2626 [Asaia krungthepensis NRIC 0535]|uniref:DUF1440 domain-containing protein n=2 Tax=Asaia krungthepensis TaxID=220990 RepID=A0ABQ0Q5Q5_9PROT|nr:hypothetical protein AA0535_2626 [Asaia krungthepensis NRIC 0535]